MQSFLAFVLIVISLPAFAHKSSAHFMEQEYDQQSRLYAPALKRREREVADRNQSTYWTAMFALVASQTGITLIGHDCPNPADYRCFVKRQDGVVCRFSTRFEGQNTFLAWVEDCADGSATRMVQTCRNGAVLKGSECSDDQ